jgi:hypothetical protein
VCCVSEEKDRFVWLREKDTTELLRKKIVAHEFRLLAALSTHSLSIRRLQVSIAEKCVCFLRFNAHAQQKHLIIAFYYTISMLYALNLVGD